MTVWTIYCNTLKIKWLSPNTVFGLLVLIGMIIHKKLELGKIYPVK